MMNLLLVLLGGGLGAATRYSTSLWLGKSNGISFPWSTFMVNISGCFLIGLLSAIAIRYKWNEQMIIFVMTGFLGGFTTFSSFGLEFYQLMKNNQMQLALLYVGLSNFVGLGVCALGYNLVKI